MNNLNWHFTAHEVKAFFLDARAFSLFPMLLLIKSLILFIFAFIFLFFFVILWIKGMSFVTFRRKLRIRLTGSSRSVRRLL